MILRRPPSVSIGPSPISFFFYHQDFVFSPIACKLNTALYDTQKNSSVDERETRSPKRKTRPPIQIIEGPIIRSTDKLTNNGKKVTTV